VNRFSNQVLEWDGPPAQMPTRDKLIMVVDNFARWRITDPKIFFQQLSDERTSQSRLDSIVGGATRDVIASHDFIEVIRSTANRQPERDATLVAADNRIGTLPAIKVGRSKLETLILERAKPVAATLGIELMDVRFKRLNYNPGVSRTIYQRMSSEREQIAERFRSEGAGEAAKILGNRDRDLKEVESLAYKTIQEVEGAADAKATEIYAKAYNQSPEAIELFEFMRSMDTLKKTITPETALVLTTEGDLFRYLKSASPAPATQPDVVKP
jgi:modulator of FtsH protease HflC